ncbi:MAG: hypothetical protein FJ405_00420, partial [Verrucomicrobia bacterium]|nr:hypothetical protein [Verrucomicrobiota bacterium]
MNHLYQALRERLCLPEGKLRLFPMWRSLTGLFPCLLVLLLSPSSRAAAPANDTFASSHLLTGAAGDVNGNTTDATREAGEPELTATSAGGSLWYSWHCSSGGTFDLEVGNGFVVGVFTGMDVDALVPVGVNPGQNVRVTLTPGWVYRVAVDSEGGTRGVFSLRWKQTLRPGGGPDLMVPQDRIQLAVVEQSFPLGDCEVTERCVLSGKRRLLRFDMHTVNAGSEDIVFGA